MVERIVATAELLFRAIRDSDGPMIHKNYDQLLWFICTASSAELGALAERMHETPMVDLPSPLQVVLFRLAGLEHLGDVTMAKLTTEGIALHCDPIEEHCATASIKGAVRE